MNFNMTQEELRTIDVIENSDELDVISLSDIESDHIFDFIKGFEYEL